MSQVPTKIFSATDGDGNQLEISRQRPGLYRAVITGDAEGTPSYHSILLSDEDFMRLRSIDA